MIINLLYIYSIYTHMHMYNYDIRFLFYFSKIYELYLRLFCAFICLKNLWIVKHLLLSFLMVRRRTFPESVCCSKPRLWIDCIVSNGWLSVCCSLVVLFHYVVLHFVSFIKWVTEWRNIWMVEWLKEWLNQWLNKCSNEWQNIWSAEGMTEWLNDWVYE